MSDGLYTPQNATDVFIVTACTGKDTYPSPQLAHRRLREMGKKAKFKSKKGKAKRGARVVYRCAVCHLWHLGSA